MKHIAETVDKECFEQESKQKSLDKRFVREIGKRHRRMWGKEKEEEKRKETRKGKETLKEKWPLHLEKAGSSCEAWEE